MQLNRRTDYAFRTLVFLALQKCSLTRIDEISNRFLISRNHLTKIINRLARLNYIITIRGNRGGLRLNKNTLEVSLAEIARNFESTFMVVNCKKPRCPLEGGCHLNVILNKASEAFLEVLEGYTLNDLLPQTKSEESEIKVRLQFNRPGRQLETAMLQQKD